MRYTLLLSVCVLGIVLCLEHDFKGFDDSILFGFNWPGTSESLGDLVDENFPVNEGTKDEHREILQVKTSDKEQYECRLPELHKKEHSNIGEYDGPSPLNLLKPLFSQKICSYRLESYWSYEVCHGRYIRQYHEEREGKQVKTQEYFLGHWSIEKQVKLEAELLATQDAKTIPKTTKVEGLSLPYVEMVMDEGTICDLSGKPRLTRVLYVCYNHGKHEVYSFKETSTCEYEIIILCPLLCHHPQFKQKEISENMIDCLPVGDAPVKPRSLLKMEVESLKFNRQSIRLLSNEKDAKDVLAVLKVEKIDKDGETHLKFELHPLGEDEEVVEVEKSSIEAEKPSIGEKSSIEPEKPVTNLRAQHNKPPFWHDDSPVKGFLNAERCLQGGTGWWKYEFCYGKHVTQYHIDRTGQKSTVLLGKFDKKAHLEWIKENKGKAPKPLEHRTSLSHLYSNGDICDATNKPRQTEVKLKCLENASSMAQVSLYLLEPRTCHYILGVESPLICEILPLADENGLVNDEKPTWASIEAEIEKKKEEDTDSKQKDVPKFGYD